MEGELVHHHFGLVALQGIDYFSQGWRVAIRFLYRLEKREVKLSRANYIIKNKREKIFSRRGNLLLVFDIQLRVARSFTFELVADALIFRRSTSSRGGFDGKKKKERRKERKNWGRIKKLDSTTSFDASSSPTSPLIPTSNFIEIPRFERINTRLIPLPVLRCYSL